MAKKPDELMFEADVQAGPFISGVDRGRWRLISVDWPHAVIAVSATPRDEAQDEYFFRFDLLNYRVDPPTARLWDVDQDRAMDSARWPAGTNRVQAAFNPGWKDGIAIYIPCDRLAIAGHDQWPRLYPHMIWSPARDITQYLQIVHDLLNSTDYTGVRGA